MVQACLSAYGRVDILVNNIGGSAAGGPVDLPEEAWDAQVDYNLKTVFLSCKEVIPVMEKAGGGAIVNTASTSGIRWTGAAHRSAMPLPRQGSFSSRALSPFNMRRRAFG